MGRRFTIISSLIATRLSFTGDSSIPILITRTITTWNQKYPHINYGTSLIRRFHTFRISGRKAASSTISIVLTQSMTTTPISTSIKGGPEQVRARLLYNWLGDRTSGPAVFTLKLNDETTREKLGLAADEAYGPRAVMYGRPGTCDDGNVSPVNGGLSMFTRIGDLFSNSVLINGRL